MEDVKVFGGESQKAALKRETKKPTPEEILQIIHDSKVLGLGGAGYPAFTKIKSVINSKAKKKYFIINCVECDPGLVHDHWLVRNFPGEICEGIELIRSLENFESVIVAVKDRKGINFPKDILLKSVPNYYPAGAERILIKEVIGKTLFFDQFPSSQGILVLNIQTVYSIYNAVYGNKHDKSRYLTVANLKEGKSQVVKVSSDTLVNEIAGSLYPGEMPVFRGGGLMQACMAEDGDKVGENTNFIAIGEFPRYKESLVCSKCYECVKNCPAGLNVCKIANLVDEERYGLLFNYVPQKCISCGSCSYVCLAGRNLSSRVKKAKDYVKSTKVKKPVQKQ
jgi:Na+-translocating ferredoxin:NAD+ oxidoreductase RnfC subunit